MVGYGTPQNYKERISFTVSVTLGVSIPITPFFRLPSMGSIMEIPWRLLTETRKICGTQQKIKLADNKST